MNVNEVKNKADREMIIEPGLTARCTEVGDKKTGSGQYGAWSVQSLTLEDASGKIRVSAWDYDDLKTMQRQMVTVHAHKGDNGHTGCQVEEREYQGKKFKQLKMKGGDIKVPTSEMTDPSHENGQGAIQWWDYIQAMRGAHAIATELEPDTKNEDTGAALIRSNARASLVNTMMIAFSQGKVQAPAEEPREPDSDVDIPF